MQKKKILSLLMAVTLVGAATAGCNNSNSGGTGSSGSASGQSSDSGSGEPVKISILNSKSEIQSQFEQMAAKYGEEKGITFDVLVTGNDSPSQEITKRYASGEAPTLFMGDVQDIYMLLDKTYDMSAADWADEQGTKEYGVVTDDGKLVAFPLCIEARGLMYNKTAIEKITGEEFKPESIQTQDQLKELLDKLVAGGMETPVALNMEDWSLAGHYLTMVYEEAGANMDDTDKFINDLIDGKANLNSNPRWTSLMDTFDLLKEYNLSKADPISADYDENAVSLAEGKVAFWFNGNWSWAEMKDFASDEMEYGIMPVPQNNQDNGVTEKLAGSASKRIMIDNEFSTEAERKAALDWLSWLVYDEEGQKFLVEDCELVPAFANNNLEVVNPLSASVQKYANDGALIDGYPYYPGDHWKEMGAEFQKYLAGNTNREEFAGAVETYWTKQEKAK